MPFLRRRGNLASETEPGHTTSVSAESGPSAEFDAHHHGDPSEAPSAPAELPNSHSSSSPARRQDNRHLPLRPESPPIQEQSQRHKRFSTLRFRNASDSQLSVKLKQHAENPPPVPTPRMCLPKPIPDADHIAALPPFARIQLTCRPSRSPRHHHYRPHHGDGSTTEETIPYQSRSPVSPPCCHRKDSRSSF